MLAPQLVLDELLAAALAAALPAGKFTALPPPPAGQLLVLGGGKAGASMAAAFEAAYAGALSGVVVVPYGYRAPTKSIEIIEAAHPVPDVNSERAAQRMLELAAAASAADQVVFLGSGGASALLAAAAAGVTLADKQDIGAQLLRAGAAINDFNAVRRCLSAIKGGRLAAACAPAPVTTYLISDVPGDEPAVIGSGPTLAQASDAAAALAILERYGVAVADHVVRAMQANASPQLAPAAGVHMLVRPADALAAAAQTATKLGVTVINQGAELEGEAREVGQAMATKVLELAPVAQPTVVLSGGELTVTVTGSGTGGSNLEFVLALALALEGAAGISALAVDTDGWDGNSGVAGARIDPTTLPRARAAGLDPAAMLAANDAYPLFAQLGDLLDTGPTLTNVNDFRAVLVQPAAT